MHNSWMKTFEYQMKLTDACALGYNWQEVSIGSGNDLES